MFWYEEDVKQLEKRNLGKNKGPATLFYGSSSLRMWPDMDHDFEPFDPVNLGFGGSTLAACSWFFNRIVKPYEASAIVIYAGDNDLGDGRHPEEVYIFFKQLTVQIQEQYGDIPCFFVSIKPSIARWNLIDALKYTNNIIASEIIRLDANWHYIDIFTPMLKKDGTPDKNLFADDGLHLTPAGYAVWQRVISAKLTSILHPDLT